MGGWIIRAPNFGYGDRICVSENDVHDGSYYNTRSARPGNRITSESADNARLIAAAPDLLAALQSFLRADDGAETIDAYGDAVRLALAAISKAIGVPK
jgi:hypothetical protein